MHTSLGGTLKIRDNSEEYSPGIAVPMVVSGCGVILSDAPPRCARNVQKQV